MINETNASQRQLELYEILDMVKSNRKKEEKIKILKNNATPAVIDYCRCVFDDRVQFLLPDGKPPYTPCKEESVPSSWHKQNKSLQYIVKGLAGEKLVPLKRESIFIGILESVHPRDSEILVKMINKEPPFKSLTKEIVKEAFPDILPKQ